MQVKNKLRYIAQLPIFIFLFYIPLMFQFFQLFSLLSFEFQSGKKAEQILLQEDLDMKK